MVGVAPSLHPPLIVAPNVGVLCLWEVLGSQPKTTMVWLPASPAKRPNEGQGHPQSTPMRGNPANGTPRRGAKTIRGRPSVGP